MNKLNEEVMVMDMEKLDILHSLCILIEEIEELIFRHQYYKDELSKEHLEDLKEGLRSIIRSHQ